jgi:hypothetical protein
MSDHISTISGDSLNTDKEYPSKNEKAIPKAVSILSEIVHKEDLFILHKYLLIGD